MLEQLRKARREESGFTLIELLIVIVILGVLAGIVIFAVGGITDRGNASACKSDVKTVEVASEAYRAKNGTYAADMPALVTANLLREVHVAGANGYTITYDNTNGNVGATGVTGCP
ncbi:competence type IV pilus major pilin ComGC [Jatrophihabitans sp.]|uniref:competence type IV pilus major pilin ComGC n=1 Tax=Jatrophihabitans sp. TaxID=1932789 RepID=UPI002BD3A3E3|nr:prepilin-type N-terminal cleavage/methylation domain-containing protein [Jatrophihabitans sp.]